MSIERLRDNGARKQAETHYLHLPDLDKLRTIIMLAIIASSSQACSFRDDPIPDYNDPNANNGTIMDAGVDAADFQDANTDMAIIDSDQDLDTAADLTDPNDTLVPDADTDTIPDDFTDSYTDPGDSLEGNDAEQDITTPDTPDQDNGDTDIELPLDSDGDGVPNDVDSCPEKYNPRQALLTELNGVTLRQADPMCTNLIINCDGRSCTAANFSGGIIDSLTITEQPSNYDEAYLQMKIDGDGNDVCHNFALIALDDSSNPIYTTGLPLIRIADTTNLGFCTNLQIPLDTASYQINATNDENDVLGSAKIQFTR